MTRPPKDDEREERIDMEIIVDAYGPEERAMGWYNHLNDNMEFPFKAQCIATRSTSPLEVGDEVEVLENGFGGRMRTRDVCAYPLESSQACCSLKSVGGCGG